MTIEQEQILNDLICRYPKLKKCKNEIAKSYDLLCEMYQKNGKLLVAGNGGSAADAEHIVGELMKGFKKTRDITDDFGRKLKEVDAILGGHLAKKLQRALPAISLAGHPGLSTAYLNDVSPVLGFAQQVHGFGCSDDILLAISTSGNSQNMLYAAVVARAKGMQVIGLTGNDGGKLKDYSDISIIVDEQETYRIQELHLPVYHALCLMLEERFF